MARREALSCFVHDVLSNQSDEVEAGDRPRRVGVAGTAADCQITVESERGSRTPRKLLPSCAASTRTAITGTQVKETARCSSPTVSTVSVLVVAAPKACGPSRSSTEEQLRSRRATLSTPRSASARVRAAGCCSSTQADATAAGRPQAETAHAHERARICTTAGTFFILEESKEQGGGA